MWFSHPMFVTGCLTMYGLEDHNCLRLMILLCLHAAQNAIGSQNIWFWIWTQIPHIRYIRIYGYI